MPIMRADGTLTSYYVSPLKEPAKRLKCPMSALRIMVFDMLGGRCNRCGFKDVRALQIDHVGGGGCKEVKKLGTKRMLERILTLQGDGYQILCANCNWIKRYENGEYIQKREIKVAKIKAWKSEKLLVRRKHPAAPCLVSMHPSTFLPDE